MKKNNHSASKTFIIYSTKNLVLMTMIKNTIKAVIIVIRLENIRGAARNICNLRHKTPKEIPIVFHNGSKYEYCFIIKELAEEFKGQFERLEENNEKYITFSLLLFH